MFDFIFNLCGTSLHFVEEKLNLLQLLLVVIYQVNSLKCPH